MGVKENIEQDESDAAISKAVPRFTNHQSLITKEIQNMLLIFIDAANNVDYYSYSHPHYGGVR